MGKQRPDETDLRPFLVVRKTKVLAALQFLIQNNQLYQDVQISHSPEIFHKKILYLHLTHDYYLV